MFKWSPSVCIESANIPNSTKEISQSEAYNQSLALKEESTLREYHECELTKAKLKNKESKRMELKDGEDLDLRHTFILLETRSKPWMREECRAVGNSQETGVTECSWVKENRHKLGELYSLILLERMTLGSVGQS